MKILLAHIDIYGLTKEFVNNLLLRILCKSIIHGAKLIGEANSEHRRVRAHKQTPNTLGKRNLGARRARIRQVDPTLPPTAHFIVP